MLFALRQWDVSTLRCLYGGEAAGVLGRLMIALTVIGSGWALLGLIPLLVHARTRRFAAHLLGVTLVAAVVVSALKELFHRARPCITLGDIHALWDDPRDFSLPSGHATGGFVVAGFVAVAVLRSGTRPRVSMALSLFGFALAAAIAISRVYLGVHYPTDVIAGAALGLLLGIAGGLRYTTTSPERPAPASQ
jgi:undecaprenyl-diphosphatase